MNDFEGVINNDDKIGAKNIYNKLDFNLIIKWINNTFISEFPV